MEKQTKSKERKDRLDDGGEEALKASGKSVLANIFLLLFGQFCRRRKVRREEEA